MPNTFTQLYIQFVFAVKGRKNFVREDFRESLEKVICGIVKENKCKPIAIYCNPDHTHVFIGLNPNISPSKLMELVKSHSSQWISKNIEMKQHFSWQKGFGAFSYSKSHIDNVVKYILNQPNHHKKQSFKKEYLAFLEKFEIDYDEKYLFEWYE